MTNIGKLPCQYPNEPGSRFTCRCHERVGNDFYFLPANTCLEEPKPPRPEASTSFLQDFLFPLLGWGFSGFLLGWGLAKLW